MNSLKLNKMDIFIAACMGICLAAYLCGHFINNPFPDALDVMKYFGLGLGLNQIGK